MNFSKDVKYVGVFDPTIDLFEGQYAVPEGVSYNSYMIVDEKIAVMDTVDRRKTNEWLANVEAALEGREPDYLVISHLEPDHSGSIAAFSARYPKAQLVVNAKSLSMLPQFFEGDFAGRSVVVKEGDSLSLGKHTLTFVTAPMVHWPEVMVEYEQTEKILFSADAFGTFGPSGENAVWDDEAGRYYINIVGKYGANVQALLKKAAGLEIETICPLHGPVLTGNLGYYIEKYNAWSTYTPDKGDVLVAYASIHGNTAAAAKKIAERIESRGEKAELFDLARCDMSRAVEAAFRCGRMVLASSTYDAGLFPPMESFLAKLKGKTLRSRRVALVENGSWAPMAGKIMRAALEEMRDMTVCEKVLTIKSTLKAEQESEIDELLDELSA